MPLPSRAVVPLLALLLAACAVVHDEEVASSTAAITSCVAGPRPATGYALEPALGGQGFSNPVAMLPIPTDSSRFYVVEKTGYVRLAATNGTKTTFADLHLRVNATANEAGLLGMALHPKFATNGVVFFSYTKTSTTAQSGLASVIARGKTNDGGATLDMSSIVEIFSFDQPYSNHNGGNIAFGPDGFLYAGYGDGGSGGDPQGNGQNKNTLLGKMLRLDVDHGSPYAIPSDNPFRNGGGRPEIYAWGVRNPWRWTFDRVTGDLWAGDVGQNKYEEVDKIVLGGNYGWGMREGFHCYSTPPCNVAGAIDPIVEYDHSQGFSITGGYVYRGTALPALAGKYLYGDFGTGRIWAIPTTNLATTPAAVLVMESGLQIASFAQDNAGELYVLDYGSGKISRIIGTIASSGIPQKLSQTGCFDASDPTSPNSVLVPYDVSSPLWSDGAEKSRWMALPPSGKIKVGADGDWDLPIGTILVKEFRLGGKRVETRLFMRHTDGTWGGYSYEWDASETDATLLPDGKTKNVSTGFGSTQAWTYPSRAQCMGCHNAATGGSIGLETAQLNHDFTYPDGTTSNQLTKLGALGMFSASAPLPPSSQRPALPSPSDTSASDEDRARSYLHANCAFCHRPQGPGRGAADWRFMQSLDQTHACNAAPEAGTLGILGAKLIVAGDPSSSLVSVRMHATDASRMPPLGSAIVDTNGTAVVDAWISSLTTCP